MPVITVIIETYQIYKHARNVSVQTSTQQLAKLKGSAIACAMELHYTILVEKNEHFVFSRSPALLVLQL